MLELLIKEEKRIEIDLFELRSESEISYSIETIKYLNKKYQESDIYMVLGSDLISNLNSWKNWGEIKKRVKLICFNRSGYIIKNKLKNIKYITDVDLNVSSSYIKEKILSKNTNRLQISKYMTKDVSEYIFKKLKMGSC